MNYLGVIFDFIDNHKKANIKKTVDVNIGEYLFGGGRGNHYLLDKLAFRDRYLD